MKVLFNGKEIGEVVTNQSMTIEEALEFIGYNVYDQDYLQRAYNNDEPWAYINDDGKYDYDFESLELK